MSCFELIGLVMQMIGSSLIALPIFFGKVFKIHGEETFSTENAIRELQRWRCYLKSGFAVYLLGYLALLWAALQTKPPLP
jgi:hypothetical protein